MMDTFLTGIKHGDAIVYTDDALVYGETFEEFCNALRDVLYGFREPSKELTDLQAADAALSIEVAVEKLKDDEKLTVTHFKLLRVMRKEEVQKGNSRPTTEGRMCLCADLDVKQLVPVCARIGAHPSTAC
ncbi:hypothetical protein EVAR_40538_1 [Eumeta japonica]|uniref:Uncharacterized protein n=1 Tax=Eumeta variegata TaxID=151549 RepID=A0A4C1XSL0_EUMVA|nr:hypothetical protein EVAR_40538_1 [Eumeta japonica]